MQTKFYNFIFFALALFLNSSYAQVTGVKNIPGDYATIQAAVSDINAVGIGAAGATINIAAGHTETATVAIVLTANPGNPSSSRPLIFQKNGSGANPVITAFTGTTTNLDGIFVLDGVDYVTINGIDLQENATNLNATQQMEFGYALLKTSGPNGCQNNTIKNCVVTLNKANTASIAIYAGNHTTASLTGLTLTSFTGTHSFNKYYNNTVQNCYTGYSLVGFGSVAPFDLYDQGNEIGVDGVSTNLSQVLNFGGSSVASNGILTNNQNNIKIFNTTINGGAGTTSTLIGISLIGGTNSNANIYNNSITLASATTTSSITGINNTSGITGAGNTINIYNNIVTGCNLITATSAVFRGIFSSATATYTNIYGNTVSNNTLAGTGEFSAIFYGGSSATLCLLVNINNNTISNNSKTGTAGVFNAIFASASTNTTNTFSNIISNNTNSSSSATTYGYFNFGVGYNENVYNNTISNLTGGAGETLALSARSGSGPTKKEVYGNTISGISGSSGTATVGAIQVDYATIANVYKNNIFNITNTFSGTSVEGAVFGIHLAGATSANTLVTVHNNYVSDLKAPAISQTPTAIYGIWLQGSTISTLKAFNNTVYLNTSSSGANFGTSAIHLAATAVSLEIRNNILVNTSTAAGAGFTRGISRPSAPFNNYAFTSGYNCIYAGTPSATNLIFGAGPNNAQTIQDFKNLVSPREQTSFSEMPPFVNIATTPYDLHLQTSVATQCESGGVALDGITQDYDGNTRNAIPDVGADEFAGITVDTASPDIQYTLLTSSSVAASRTLTAFATITDRSGVNVTAGTKPRLYYKKFAQANTYNDNTNATDGWKYVEASNATSPFNFTIDYTKLLTGVVTTSDIIQYFVTAQDLNITPRIGLNSGGFTTQPASVNLAAANFPLNNTINQYGIVANTYSGTINVGATETISSLTNVGGLFNLLNAGVVSGNITVNITSDLTAETGVNSLSQWAEEGVGNYTVTIVPSAGVTRLISGTNSSNSLINLNGADRVTIDGRFAGAGKFLTFRNVSTAAPTIGFLNDAQNNTVRNAIIESGNTAVTALLTGVVNIGATNVSNGKGNDNITITECDIRDRSDIAATPARGIHCDGFSAGTIAQYNDNITISNNNIYNWFLVNATSLGISIGAGNSDFTITGNSIYQTAPRTNTAAGGVIRGINIQFPSTVNSNGGHTIANNFIGGTAPGATGGDMTFTVTGAGTIQTFPVIAVSTGLKPNSIQNNTIRKIDFTTNSPTGGTTFFSAINLTQGIFNVGTITGNTIGAATGNDAIKININAGGTATSFIAGIIGFGTSGYFNIQNNTIGGITIGGTATSSIIPQFIQVQNTPAQNTIISNNLIGSLTTPNSNNITFATAPVSSFGIRSTITSGVETIIQNNTIQNTMVSSTATNNVSYGVLLFSSVGQKSNINVSNNSIRNININSLPTAPVISLVGISLQGFAGTNHVISDNTISNLNNLNTGTGASYVMGVQTQGNTTGGVMNRNRIYDLKNSNSNSTPGLSGIFINSGLNWSLNNNRISLTNGANSNNVDLSGISNFMNLDSNINLNYNSIYLGGTVATGTTNSVAYTHGSFANVNAQNNLFYNERTGGTGNHVAIASTSITPTLGFKTMDTNAYVTADASKIGILNTTVYDFANWKTFSGKDANSITALSTTETSAALFQNAATADLRLNTSIFPVGFATPIALSTDFEGEARSATDPTIGSDEKACIALSNGATEALGVVTATQTGLGVTYQWFTCPNSILVGETNQAFTPTVVGNYKVVISFAGCSTESNCITVNTLGTNQTEKGSKVLVYPNPSNGLFTINSEIDADFVLVNQIGQIVKNISVKANQDLKIATTNLTSGLYILKEKNNKVGAQKLVIN